MKFDRIATVCIAAELIKISRTCIYCDKVVGSRGLDWSDYSYRFGIDGVITAAHCKCHKEHSR